MCSNVLSEPPLFCYVREPEYRFLSLFLRAGFGGKPEPGANIAGTGGRQQSQSSIFCVTYFSITFNYTCLFFRRGLFLFIRAIKAVLSYYVS